MSMTKFPQIELDEFGNVLFQQRLHNQFITGLIIRKSNSSKSVEEIRQYLPDAILIKINKDQDDSEILAALKEAFSARKWIIFHLEDGALSPLWREQLSRLSDSNSVFIQGDSLETSFFADQPDEMRVVVVIDEENIANVNYDEFLALFKNIIEV